MALPMLVGAADSCGPSNPLQGLSKRFDQDRGLQQDYFGAGRAGSSKDAFRSQRANAATPDQDAARFFGASNTPVPAFSPEAAYDMSALHTSLSTAHSQAVQHTASWAADFTQQMPLQTLQQPIVMEAQSKEMSIQHTTSPVGMAPQGTCGLQWTLGIANFRMNTMPNFMPQMVQPAPMNMTANQISWDKEFSALDMDLQSSPAAIPVQQVEPKQETAQQGTHEGDELARTAGLLLEHMKHEQNPKFQKSQFLGLMKQLRDGEVIVEGNDMVESNGRTSESAAATDVKGKGRAMDAISSGTSLDFSGRQSPGLLGLRGIANYGGVNYANDSQDTRSKDVVEDENDAYFRQENAEYARYWNDLANSSSTLEQDTSTNAETRAWDKLQEDWDRFEATTDGIRAVNLYQFQQNNPYLLGNSSMTRQHQMHADNYQTFFESALELEAAVQRQPDNAMVWYELGVKQQENEREHKALQALQRAVELDPSHLPAWLALAISHTNDSNRQGTYSAINEWVTRNEKYRAAVSQFETASGPLSRDQSVSITERYSHLIQCLIAMARSDMSGEVDADIQIALAVLLNTNEDYEKAQDCFRTALAVRPDDWLLYNRVGATMANSGRAEEALNYYYKALELNPAYIRARFNLGISCINLKRYEEAAHHILDALVLQDSDGVTDSSGTNEKRGVTSKALWDSLRTTCLHMQRGDLASLCDRNDLEGFRNQFLV